MILMLVGAASMAPVENIVAQVAPAVDPAPAEVAKVSIAKGTAVAVIIDRSMESNTVQVGSMFPLHLADPVIVDGKVILPAGTAGEGEVIHAAKARFGGKAGELIVNARYVSCNGVRIPLGKLKFAAAGENRTGAALAASAVFLPAAFIISGGNVTLPQGTRADATIVGAVEIVPPAGGTCH